MCTANKVAISDACQQHVSSFFGRYGKQFSDTLAAMLEARPWRLTDYVSLIKMLSMECLDCHARFLPLL